MKMKMETLEPGILSKIENCKSCEELETLNDLVDDAFQARLISKKEYKYFEEKFDDQITEIVEIELAEKRGTV